MTDQPTVTNRESDSDAAELELERAHRLLDECGVPREVRAPGQSRPVELSLVGRMQLFLEDEEEDEV